jgi:D-aspartate ligase
MRNTDDGPPCVVIGAQLNGLGVARSLAAAGVRVVVASVFPGPARWSRRVQFARLRALEGPQLLDDLLALAGRLGQSKPVLLLTDEQCLLTLSAERERLAEAYRFALPDHHTLLDLLEKSRFQRLAEAGGYPIPRALTVRGPADLAALDGLSFPCVLKPSRRTAAYETSFLKAYVAHTAAAAGRCAEAMLTTVPEVMIQEWIVGDDCDIHFCLVHMDRNGRADAAFVGRKLRVHPPRVGLTASCTPAPEAADELTALTGRFFGEIGCCGLASMEYKRDRRDGRFYMVEPTVGRTDWQEEVATLNGVNLPMAAYRYLTGQPPITQEPLSPPRVWCNRFDHVISGFHDDSRPARLPSKAIVVDALWRWNDPLPAFFGYAPPILDRLRARMWGGLRPDGIGLSKSLP